MKEKLRGIVLSRIRHNDRTAILNIYTAERGRMAVAVSAASGRGASLRNAAQMPLSQIEFTADIGRGVGSMPRASSLALTVGYRTIFFDPAKNAVGIFLAEFLSRYLREATPDAPTYSYISRSLLLLDALERGVGNFHITFLAGLTAFAGIMPDVEDYSPHAVFDMRAGRYTTLLPVHRDYLQGEAARVPRLLVRLNFANQSRLRLNRTRRGEILDGLLRYYALHFPGMTGLKSPEILETIFA